MNIINAYKRKHCLEARLIIRIGRSRVRRKNYSFYVSEHHKEVSDLIEEFLATSPGQFSDLICYCIKSKASECIASYDLSPERPEQVAGE